MNFFALTAIVTSTFTAPVDTLTGADFDLPKEIVEKDMFSLEKHGVEYAPWLLALPEYVNETLVDEMVAFSRKFKGIRYRSGGKTPAGFDCSGFTGYVFKKFGMTLGASSAIQATQGKPVDPAELRPGDLLFFSRGSKSRRVGHVGMVTEVDSISGRARFIHATTRNGITESSFPSDSYYRTRFITARRIL